MIHQPSIRTRTLVSDTGASVLLSPVRRGTMPLRATTLASLCLLAATCLLAAAAPASAAPRGLDVGFLDYLFSQSNDGERIARLDEAHASGASTVRVHLDWATIARRPP